MNTEYKIFDSHAHYDDDSFDLDRSEIMKELKSNGVVGVMNCSSSYESIKKTCELINTWDFIYGAVGIHPENADEFKDEMIDEIIFKPIELYLFISPPLLYFSDMISSENKIALNVISRQKAKRYDDKQIGNNSIGFL